MKLGHTTSSDSDGIANLFATNFGMVVTELCPPITDQFEPHSNPIVPTVPQLAFPEAEVLGTLASCDASKRGGPDGIPGIFLKNCAHTLAKPLSLIFKKIHHSGNMSDTLEGIVYHSYSKERRRVECRQLQTDLKTKHVHENLRTSSP